MEVTFGESELAALCNSEHLMVRRWGRDVFEYLGRRLFELAGAADLDHVTALPGVTLSRDGPDRVTIGFDRGRLVVNAQLIERPEKRGAGTKMEQDGLHIIGLDVRARVRSR